MSRSVGSSDGAHNSSNQSGTDGVLSLEDMPESLSNILRTVDGTGFAFSELSIEDKSLTDIKILQKYPHIQHLRARNNLIADISPLTSIAALVTADVADNCVEKLPAFSNPFLQVLDLSNNKLLNLSAFSAPRITFLKLDSNNISSLAGISICKTLQRLDVNDNKLATTSDIRDLPALRMLQAADNEIADLRGLHTLPALEVLNLAGNQLSNLRDFCDACTKLRVLDIGHNLVNDVDELGNLDQSPLLERISLAGAHSQCSMAGHF